MKGSVAVVAVVGIFAVMVLYGIGAFDTVLPANLQSGGGFGNINLNFSLPGQEAAPQVIEIKTDLRSVFGPYIQASPTIPTACAAAGGIWRWQEDWAGCDGAGGGANCNTVVAFYMSELCRSAGAVWVCDAWSSYCIHT